MKNLIRIFSAAILCSLMACAQVTTGESPCIRTYNAEHDFGFSVTHGKLVFQMVILESGRLGSYVYQDSSNHRFLLSNRIDGINKFLGDEIASGSDAQFLMEQMAYLLLYTMSPPESSIIDDKFLASYKAEVSSQSGSNFIDDPALSVSIANDGSIDSIPKLEHYKSDATPRVTGNDWVLEFNVATAAGGIEHWRIAGQLSPLLIRSFYREIAEPNGTYVPLIYVGKASPTGSSPAVR